MYRIAGYLQNYAWGIPGGLAAWRGGSDEVAPPGQSPAPEAELWYGAHVNGPSPLIDGSGGLTDVVATGCASAREAARRCTPAVDSNSSTHRTGATRLRRSRVGPLAAQAIGGRTCLRLKC